MRQTTVSYIKLLHKEDAITGINGQCLSPTNPPAYVKGDVEEVRKIGENYCCDEMRKQFEAERIGFGSRSEDTYKNKLTDIFIWSATDIDLVIAYCPWCAAPVLTHEVAVI